MSDDRIVVQFSKTCGLYNAGEVAGFDPAEADRYLKAGVAVPYPPAPAPVADKALDEPAKDKQIKLKGGRA